MAPSRTAEIAGTRVARFVVQEFLGGVMPRLRDNRWLPGVWLSSALIALTLADAIRQPVRYLFLLGGITVLLTGSLAVILIELLSS